MWYNLIKRSLDKGSQANGYTKKIKKKKRENSISNC